MANYPFTPFLLELVKNMEKPHKLHLNIILSYSSTDNSGIIHVFGYSPPKQMLLPFIRTVSLRQLRAHKYTFIGIKHYLFHFSLPLRGHKYIFIEKKTLSWNYLIIPLSGALIKTSYIWCSKPVFTFFKIRKKNKKKNSAPDKKRQLG